MLCFIYCYFFNNETMLLQISGNIWWKNVKAKWIIARLLQWLRETAVPLLYLFLLFSSSCKFSQTTNQFPSPYMFHPRQIEREENSISYTKLPLKYFSLNHQNSLCPLFQETMIYAMFRNLSPEVFALHTQYPVRIQWSHWIHCQTSNLRKQNKKKVTFSLLIASLIYIFQIFKFSYFICKRNNTDMQKEAHNIDILLTIPLTKSNENQSSQL